MDRILFVDDDKNIQSSIAMAFAGQEYTLEFASTGEEALNSVSVFNPDLILLDINMPGMDGFAVCSQIKSNDQTSGVMILFQSARFMLEDRLKGYEAGADDYITKPYSIDELFAKIKILLRLKRTQDELKKINRNLERLVEKRTKELLKKERLALIGQMVQGIVHNLQNPITICKGMICVAVKRATALSKICKNEKKELADKIMKHLSIAAKSADEVELLIQNMLSKSRNESINDTQLIDLNSLIKKELYFFDADLHFKNKVKKNLILDDTLPKFVGTYVDFSQLCANMIRNALDAMYDSTEKELIIKTSHDHERIYIEFQDTGTGISPANLNNVFNPFFTTKCTNESETLGPKGTGLGLYTCLELIKSYDGEIAVSSELGIGTTFSIAIPKRGKLR